APVAQNVSQRNFYGRNKTRKAKVLRIHSGIAICSRHVSWKIGRKSNKPGACIKSHPLFHQNCNRPNRLFSGVALWVAGGDACLSQPTTDIAYQCPRYSRRTSTFQWSTYQMGGAERIGAAD